jgi:nucleotide-binding universal stress UspA family protein
LRKRRAAAGYLCDTQHIHIRFSHSASDEGADLIVMGADGHSRAREIVLGGATRALFRDMTVPILMSH